MTAGWDFHHTGQTHPHHSNPAQQPENKGIYGLFYICCAFAKKRIAAKSRLARFMNNTKENFSSLLDKNEKLMYVNNMANTN